MECMYGPQVTHFIVSSPPGLSRKSILPLYHKQVRLAVFLLRTVITEPKPLRGDAGTGRLAVFCRADVRRRPASGDVILSDMEKCMEALVVRTHERKIWIEQSVPGEDNNVVVIDPAQLPLLIE